MAVWPGPSTTVSNRAITTGNVNVAADVNGATTNYLFGARCFGNSFATASARTVAVKNNVGAASPGRPFVALISDCPQNVSLAMI